jgi:hypothetical protein
VQSSRTLDSNAYLNFGFHTRSLRELKRYHRNLVDKTPLPQEGVQNGGMGHGARNLGMQPAMFHGNVPGNGAARGMVMFHGNYTTAANNTSTAATNTDNNMVGTTVADMSLESLLTNRDSASTSASEADGYDDILLDTVIPRQIVTHDLFDCDLRLYLKDFPLDVY